MRRSRIRYAAVAALVVLVASACGQKSGVALTGATGLEGRQVVIDPETGQTVDAETGEVVDPSTGEVIDGGTELGGSSDTVLGDTTSSSSSSDSSSGEDDTGTGTEEGDEPEPGEPTGGDATGVTDEVIKIGVHAPITGAAPVPSDSANKGAVVYWRWLEENGEEVLGRRVEVVIKNDQYNPSAAVSACKEMVEKDKVFLLSGAAGTDQIQACARYAASVGVPYISSGVTEIGVTGLPNYFAVSMTYPDQGPLMADFVIDELGGGDEKNAIVYFNTQNFLDGKEAYVEAMEERGVEVYQRAVSKTAGASDAQAVATDLAAQGFDNVNVIVSPVWFLQLLQATRSQNYAPQWTAPGIQMTFDAVATVGCRNGSLDGAKMFAPFPAWVDRNKFDPEFAKAVDAIFPEERGGDDFMWLGWSGSKGIHGMFNLVGENLTRERFVYFLERAEGLSNGIAPELNFTPENHFGSTAVHVSEARCGEDQRWHTIMTHKSDF
ncbi:MAG TPA: ABC transporter substrate-binding protein [Actinomycetota bacterium]|nr:ABC transporter substrate-binding protein [Actinomycetota bacterium]